MSDSNATDPPDRPHSQQGEQATERSSYSMNTTSPQREHPSHQREQRHGSNSLHNPSTLRPVFKQLSLHAPDRPHGHVAGPRHGYNPTTQPFVSGQQYTPTPGQQHAQAPNLQHTHTQGGQLYTDPPGPARTYAAVARSSDDSRNTQNARQTQGPPQYSTPPANVARQTQDSPQYSTPPADVASPPRLGQHSHPSGSRSRSSSLRPRSHQSHTAPQGSQYTTPPNAWNSGENASTWNRSAHKFGDWYGGSAQRRSRDDRDGE